MSTHTEDTKDQTIIDSESFMALDDYKVFLKEILTLYASQVREERDREIVNHFSKYLREWQDGMNDNSPSAKLTWVIDEIKSITTLTPKT